MYDIILLLCSFCVFQGIIAPRPPCVSTKLRGFNESSWDHVPVNVDCIIQQFHITFATCFPDKNVTFQSNNTPTADIFDKYDYRYYNGSLYNGQDPKKMNITAKLQQCCWPHILNCDCVERIAHRGTVLEGICHAIEAQKDCLSSTGFRKCCC